jgi:hypothetical protein
VVVPARGSGNFRRTEQYTGQRIVIGPIGATGKTVAYREVHKEGSARQSGSKWLAADAKAARIGLPRLIIGAGGNNAGTGQRQNQQYRQNSHRVHSGRAPQRMESRNPPDVVTSKTAGEFRLTARDLPEMQFASRLGGIWRRMMNTILAGLTGLEPATSTLTGWHSKPTELQPRMLGGRTSSLRGKNKCSHCLKRA